MNNNRGACMVQNTNSELEKYLSTLGLTLDDLNEDSLKSAYRKAANKFHSDKRNISAEASEDKFKEVNAANEFLKQYMTETGIGTSTYQHQKQASDFFDQRFSSKNKKSTFFATKEERELENIVKDVRHSIPQDSPANKWTHRKLLHEYTKNLLANGHFRKGTIQRQGRVEEIKYGACDTIIPLRIKVGAISPEEGIAYIVNQLENNPLQNKENYLAFTQEAHILKDELAKDYNVSNYNISQQAKQRILKTTRNIISNYAQNAEVPEFFNEEKTQKVEENYLKNIARYMGILKDEFNEYKTIGSQHNNKKLNLNITEQDFAKLHKKLYGEVSEYVLEALDENKGDKALTNIQILETLNILTGQENALETFWNQYGTTINENVGKLFVGEACERISNYAESELEILQEYQKNKKALM